jgi:hypothetical protein
MDSSEHAGQRKDIELNLRSIIENSDRWLGRIKKREFRVRLASSFLTTILVFTVVGGSFAGYLTIQGQFGALLQQPVLAEAVAGTVLLIGIISGILAYFLLKRKHEARVKELSSLIAEMKKVEADQRQTESGGVITEDALYLADKILTLLPAIVRKRNQDSLVFGAVAFIIVEVFGGNLGVAIVAGATAWLYFRYQFRKMYEQEMFKFEEQKRVFEQRKKDFMEAL